MKKILFFPFILIAFLNSKAQTNVYHPFPDSNAVWSVEFVNGMNYPNITYTYYSYTIQGDTNINTNTYNKVYKSGTYWGGLRQDILNKRIYFKMNSRPDTLIYDFSLHVGDTMHLADCSGIVNLNYGYKEKINSIDSVLVGSNYHKRFNVNGGSIIEGVGATTGLLEGFINFEYSTDLECFHSTSDYYPINNLGCSSLGIESFNNQFTVFQIYPNPNSGNFIIEPNNTTKQTLQIYDINGKIVLSQAINGKTTVDASILNEGVYNVSLRTNEGIANKRLVIVR